MSSCFGILKDFLKRSQSGSAMHLIIRNMHFAADYIRIYALYHYGGFYLDMDVEVVKPFDPYLCLTTMIGYENSKAKGLEVAAFWG